MGISTVRPLAAAIVLGALLAGQAIAGEGHNLFGDWRSEGADQFEQGELQNTRIEADTVVLDQGGHGFFLPSGVYTSSFHAVKDGFNTVIVGYDAHLPVDSEVRVQVRALGGGNHTRWHNVEQETDVVFDGVYRFLQYRVRLGTLNPEESPKFNFFTAMFGKMADQVARTEPLGTGDGDVAKPEITSRSDWKAKPPKKSYSRHSPEYLIVHHSSLPTVGGYKGASTVRGIQNFHQNDRGWVDIGYHFLIGPEGQIFQGRPETVRGAHCTPNSRKVGVCMIGDFQNNDELPAVARASLVHLLAYLSATYAIDPGSHIKGHRDFNSTNCPGIDLYNDLSQVRKDVKAFLNQAEAAEVVE